MTSLWGWLGCYEPVFIEIRPCFHCINARLQFFFGKNSEHNLSASKSLAHEKQVSFHRRCKWRHLDRQHCTRPAGEWKGTKQESGGMEGQTWIGCRPRCPAWVPNPSWSPSWDEPTCASPHSATHQVILHSSHSFSGESHAIMPSPNGISILPSPNINPAELRFFILNPSNLVLNWILVACMYQTLEQITGKKLFSHWKRDSRREGMDLPMRTREEKEKAKNFHSRDALNHTRDTCGTECGTCPI